MSLHADLSPEALERLHKQRRNATISSVLIAGLSVVLVALILGIFLLPDLVKETPTIVTYESNLKEEPDTDDQKVQVNIDRKPAAPSAQMAKTIVANTTSPTSVPVPNVDVTTPSMDFGMSEDFGEGFSDGAGSGGGFGAIPATMKKRCSPADRAARLRETGGTPQCEDAVKKALVWLKTTQKPDGSWDTNYPVSMTGLALLAYLGHCETPQSPEFGSTVSSAITYLINVGLKNKGRLTTKDANSIQWVYEHAIATYALAESYTFCSKLGINIPELDKVTKKAGDMIMSGQGVSGGWVYRYEPTKQGDNSVGFWQIQALKACKHTGLFNESKLNRTARKALDWLDKAQGSDGAIGYREDPKKSPGLTGGGVLAFQMWDKGSSSNARKGIDYISKNTSFKWGTPSADLYYHYYNAQAMINHGGKDWDKYNEMFRDELIKNQQPDGSWKQKMSHGSGGHDTHMATCLATLMLEVYYRFLPGTGAK
jgi:hypothetical protein